ncbi:ectonucleotide pyrophosphatase/phosphodiesterase 3 [Homo sapiens]|uniref:Ectonucleotide pyrophosphatase/phosphodiesterase 3 n=1 Tax=Homo sapiens TaxID=9606 RepID=E9PDB4_HUMAN|nr:ectonucleotide pyrophosphatase/phosphodiesterase 3 [Homo sapiens]KAI4019825.1 ectonucleotide pyrophosphatase/phosphodiesterase 3 [Homo sapiens]
MESTLTLATEQPVKKNTLKKYKIACITGSLSFGISPHHNLCFPGSSDPPASAS